MNTEEIIRTLTRIKDSINFEVTDSQKKMDALNEAIQKLKQEPKTGHWITYIKSDRRGDYWPTTPKCSECGGEPCYSNSIFNYKLCPYCGAKMVEEQERSV